MLYRATYHRTLREVIAHGTIEVPDDAADPHRDAAEIALHAATEMGATFFTLLRDRGRSPAFADRPLTRANGDDGTRVIWTNATPADLDGKGG